MDDFHPDNPMAGEIFELLKKHLSVDQIILIGCIKSADITSDSKARGVLGLAIKELEGLTARFEARNQSILKSLNAMEKACEFKSPLK